MNKLSLDNMQNVQGGQMDSKITPNWVDCTLLTACAGVTFIWGTPVMGLMVGGMAAGCWYKVK